MTFIKQCVQGKQIRFKICFANSDFFLSPSQAMAKGQKNNNIFACINVCMCSVHFTISKIVHETLPFNESLRKLLVDVHYN